MPLPMNVGAGDLPGITRIAIGEMTTSKGGMQIPSKLDYIRLCKGNPSRQGKTSYVPDEKLTAILQARLRELGEPDPDKPQRIPVCVLGNLVEGPDGSMQVPPQILQTGLAYFQGGRRDCHCNEFRLKTAEEAAEEGLAWPIPDGDMAGFIGDATRKVYEKKQKEIKGSDGKKAIIDIPVLQGIHNIPCNPSICPFATGTHDNAKYAGRSLCKPRVKLALYLPWAPSVGPIAQFVSTSWHSARYLESTLLNIGAHTGGWLALLPLWLNMDWQKVATREGNVSISYVYFSTDGDPHQLRLQAGRVQQEHQVSEASYKQLTEGAVTVLEAADDQEPDLYPDQEQETIDARGHRLEEFATETLGWSSAKFGAEWDATGGDVAKAVLLEKQMEAELVEKQREQRTAKLAEVAREAKVVEPTPEPELEDVPDEPEAPVEEPEPAPPPEEPDGEWTMSPKHRAQFEEVGMEIGWTPTDVSSAVAACKSAADMKALANVMKAERDAEGGE